MTLKKREKILVVCCEIVIILGAFFMFYETPQRRKISGLEEEIKAVDQKLAEARLLTAGSEKVEDEVTRLEKEFDRLSRKTLKGEEFRIFLKHLAKESDPQQMKVVSIRPQEEQVTLPENKKEPSPLPYRKVTVQMVVHSNYDKLGSYLKKLGDLPFLMNVENLQIERNEEVQPFLIVTIGLDMYIVKL